MIHLGLGGIVLILLLLVCIGGPQAVLRFIGGIGCLILVIAALIALLATMANWSEQQELKVRQAEAAEFDRLDQNPSINDMPRIAQLARDLGYNYNSTTNRYEISPTQSTRHIYPPGW